jgi:Family of unknown function (DUF5309)
MAATTGTAKTYDLTIGLKIDMDPMLYILTPTDCPLLGTYNGTSNLPPTAGNNSILGTRDCFAKKVEWDEEELLTPKTTIKAANTFATADTFIVVAAGDKFRFATGDTIVVGPNAAGSQEQIRVTGYGTTADTLTVTRAVGGSVADQYVAGASVIGVGSMLKEGSDPENFRFNPLANNYNLTEIFGPWLIQVSGSEQTISLKGGYYGVPDQFNKQVANKVREIAVAVEQAAVYGNRIDDTTNAWRSMGGLTYYITTNIDTTTTALTLASINTNWQLSYNNGGLIDTLLVGPNQRRNISQFDAPSIRLDRSETIRGQVVSELDSDFGTASVVLDRWVLKNDLFGIDRQWVDFANLRPITFEVLSKTGDSMRGQVVGEKSMRVRLQKRHLRMSTLT